MYDDGGKDEVPTPTGGSGATTRFGWTPSFRPVGDARQDEGETERMDGRAVHADLTFIDDMRQTEGK